MAPGDGPTQGLPCTPCAGLMHQHHGCFRGLGSACAGMILANKSGSWEPQRPGLHPRVERPGAGRFPSRGQVFTGVGGWRIYRTMAMAEGKLWPQVTMTQRKEAYKISLVRKQASDPSTACYLKTLKPAYPAQHCRRRAVPGMPSTLMSVLQKQKQSLFCFTFSIVRSGFFFHGKPWS